MKDIIIIEKFKEKEELYKNIMDTTMSIKIA